MYSFSYFVEKIHIVNWENVIEIFENMGHLWLGNNIIYTGVKIVKIK